MAVDLSSLSEAELSVVKKTGLSEDDIKSLDSDALKSALNDKIDAEKKELEESAREKFQETVRNSIEPKLQAVKETIEKEKEEIKKDATKLAAGYLVSTISLFAATLIAPQVIMVCKTKPSGVVYAGTAAVYVFQEMRNIKILKASQLAEIEIVNNLSIDKNKSAKENAKILEAKVDQQVGYIKAYKNTLDHAVVALKKKAQNAKIVSVGFLAASATAAAEQMNWIDGGGACVVSATQKKIIKSNNFFAQAFNTLFSTAIAGEGSSKVTLAAELKDNKAADWLGDLDKLGIVGGLAINVVAYISGWKMGFLKSVMASGTSRAIVFGVQSALAFMAAKLFENAATEMGKRLDKIDSLLNSMQNIAHKGINVVVPSDADARRFQEIASKLGVPADKLITEMSLNDASIYLKKIKSNFESLDDEGKALVNKFELDLATKLKEKAQEKSETTTRLPNLLDFLFVNAVAAQGQIPFVVTKIRNISCVENKSCPTLQFPRLENSNAKPLNQYLELYERYYHGVKVNNPVTEMGAANALEKNKNFMDSYRNSLFKKNQENAKSPHTDYQLFLRTKLTEETNHFTKFYNALLPQDKEEMNSGLNPTNSGIDVCGKKVFSENKKVKYTLEDRRVLSLLINRLDAAETSSHGPDMSFIRRETPTENDYNFGNTSIHPKESELFEIIHIRYLKFLKKNYPDL